MIKKYSFILFLIGLFYSSGVLAQEVGPGCPNVNIQDVAIIGYETIYNPDLDRYELHLPPGVNQIDLTATYLPGREGADYVVEAIAYDPPFPFTGGENAVPLTSDDYWSSTIHMGFDFCFFWEPYNQALITDNGALTFDINGVAPGGGNYTPGARSGWSFDAQIPNGNVTIPYRNAIFGVMQDLLPSASSPNYSVNHEIIGEAPCRMLVFNIFEAGHFGGECAGPGNWQTSQIVLYETTNTIDVYVEQRTICSWNSGSGLIGIQSRQNHANFPHLPNGIQAYTPPGRNTGQWTANNEAWRFTPAGEVTNTIKWYVDDQLEYDVDGNINGIDNKSFDLPNQETTIKVEGIYVDCQRIETIDVSELTVIKSTSISVDLGSDISTCDNDVVLTPTIYDHDDNEIPESEYDDLGITFLWTPNGETTSSITVTDSGTYTVEVFIDDYSVTASIEVTFGEVVLNDPIATYGSCVDLDGVATFDLTSWYEEIVPNSGDYTFTFYESENDAQTGTDPIVAPQEQAYEISADQEIWVHVIDTSGCEAIGSFSLETYEILYNDPGEYIICDNEGIGTGDFDLESKIPEIVDGITMSLGIGFFDNEADAINDTFGAQIDSPYTSGNTTIYVRLSELDEDYLNTGCFTVFSMDLVLQQGPDIQDLPPYELCGLDGTAVFDLTSVTGDLTTGLSNPVINYYEDEDDAYIDEITNEIADPSVFENTTPDAQTIYVRVQENDSPCFTVIELPLVVLPRPVVYTAIPSYAICEIADGEAIFDLTSIGVVNNPENFDISYYLSSDDARTSANPIDPDEVDAYTSTGTTIYVRVEDATNGCYDITSFNLVVNPLPILLTNEVELSECVGDTFDLTEAEDQLLADGTGFVFAYYEDLTDAEVPQNAIDASVPYPGVDGEEIIVRIDSPEGCPVFATLSLRSVAAQEVEPLIDYEICDAGNGRADFDLAGLIPGILNGDTNLEVTFYLTEPLAAIGDVDDQIDLTQDYNSATRTIWVRVVEEGLTCAGVVPLELVVNPLPILPTSVEMVACENPDGDNEFDLADTDLHTDIFVDVLGDAADYEVYFFETENQATNADVTTAIDTSVLYETAVTTRIWVRVVYADGTDCQAIVPLDLIVNPLPVINPIAPLQVCDEGLANGLATFDLNQATIDMIGESNYGVTYYIDEPTAEVGNPNDALSTPYSNVDPYNQTIYARIADNITGCSIIVPIYLVVEPAPEAHDAELVYCDPNNDGEGVFHLPDANADITSDTDAIITYHRTWHDAHNNVNPLDDTINNNELDDQAPQIVYVRVAIDGLDCFSIVELELIVLPTPVLATPAEVIIGCDIDDNGTPLFNLEEIVLTQVVIHLTDLADYNIYYYANEENRDNDVRIPVPSAYPSAGGAVIVVVEDIATGCSSEVEIELFVAPLPVVFNPLPLELCDVNNPGDEKELFYLDEATQEITGGDQSLTVTYHFSQADADAGINALEIPYENDVVNNQTIFIRVENEFGCTVTTGITLTLVVNPLPAPVTPAPLEVCDIDNEGYAYFDLDSLESEIIANEPGVNLSFHETFTDAENATNPLTSPYQNIVADEQIVFARVFFADPPNGTGCFTIIEVTLKAIPSPVVPVELDDLYFCTPDEDSSVRVNLTVYEDLIYGNQNRDDLALTYHLSQQAAEAGTGAIADPTDYLLNPPTPVTIYVRLAYTNGVCYNIVPFTIHLVEGPQINDPTALSVCTALGEPNTETAVFDLLDKREEIIGQATGLGVYFYEDEADALIGNTNYITNPTNYTNIENPQLIYVRVVDSQENQDGVGCVAFTTLTLRVEPNPEPVTPEPIVQCHLDSDADFTIVDLTIRNLQILNHESWDLEFYEKYRHAVNGDQEQVIANPDLYELALADSPKIIYVRVINPTSGCFEIVELEVILSTLPEVLPPEDIEPMIVCSTDNKDWASFDLTEKLPEIFGNQNLDGLDVFFYEDLEDAIAGERPIPDPEDFYNTSNPQTIYVGIGNPDIDDCYIGGLTWFDIEVLKGAEAFSPEETYKVCGIPGPNGGVGIFDLSNEDLIDFILGTQDPNFFDVEFFLTEDDAHEGAVEDRLGRTYENISNPQTIYVRVTNQDTGCYAIAEVVLEVIEIPGLILEDLYSFCTDAQGNPMEDADGNIIYPIIDTGLDASNNEFTWYFEDERIIGQVGPSLVADKIGTYRVEIVNLDTGCTLSLDVEVVKSSMPFNYGAEVTSPAFSGTYNVEAWADGFGDYTFSLNNGTPQDHGSFANVGTGTHVITISDKNGCGSVDVVVNVVDYPKFFTPNDDGYNDTWNIPGMGDLDPSAEIFIFDRHGKLLKQLNPQSEGWNGTFNGKPLPSTDYWFVVKYKEDGVAKEFKGHFSLKR